MYKSFFIFIFLVFPLLGISQLNVDSVTANNAYKPGEKLIYSIKYGVLKGGEASMTINVIPSGDTYYFYVIAKGVTTGLASNFAKIYDIYESYIEISTGYPVKAVRNVRENSYVRYNEVFFYRDKNYVWSINTGKHWIPQNALDILSAFYYARRNIFKQKFSKGDIIDLTTFHEGELLPLKIKYQKTDRVKCKFGKINCLKFVPNLEKNNPFKKEDDLQIWFSNDGNYIPIKIKLKTKIGSVKAELKDFDNLKNPLGVR